MSLVNCKECAKSVSSEAMVCPHCGIAAPALTKEQKTEVVRFSGFARSRKFAGALFFGGLLWLVLSAQMGGKDALAVAWGSAQWMIGAGALWYIVAEIDRNLAVRRLKKSELK